MFEQQSKLKRQLEILGLCISPSTDFILDIATLAIVFEVEDITIKRDLRELREQGIDIHSTKKRGVIVSNLDEKAKIKKLMLQYVGLCYSGNIFDRSTSLLIEKKRASAFAEIVTLQICIDKCLVAEIGYLDHSKAYCKRNIQPILIFHSDGSWRVLSQDGEQVKQFHLDKISSVKVTDKQFERMPVERFDNMFRFSFGSWIGVEQYQVLLKFNKVWAERLKDRMLAISQQIEETSEGEVIFRVTVNNLNEIAGWIVSRGQGCQVIEPPELKALVIEIANGVLENYK